MKAMKSGERGEEGSDLKESLFHPQFVFLAMFYLIKIMIAEKNEECVVVMNKLGKEKIKVRGAFRRCSSEQINPNHFFFPGDGNRKKRKKRRKVRSSLGLL